ncbi:MAG TPA: hypothetical protein VHR15_18660 [Ktedonobacterales bacterium]|jgi:hypothetical protein|nr:hypothetical protein [Ktedonobacterales bacterium]
MPSIAELRMGARLAYYKALKGRRTFTFQGATYKYLFRRYNSTYGNERAVEIPIAMAEVGKYAEDRVLEVGNVLAHYYPHHHQVVDKYERADGVMNADIVDFQPEKRYDLIVSISTLEHVGWDEEPRDPPKLLRAVERLATLLAPGGKGLITLPIGYNAALDGFLHEGRVPFTSVGYLLRITDDNQWREASWSESQGAQYLAPRLSPTHEVISATATGLVVGLIQR